MSELDFSADGAREIARAYGIASLAPLRSFIARAQNAVPVSGEVSVLLTTDAEIRKLNRKFRSKNKSTDVLSFPAFVSPQDMSPQPALAGDLAISVETAARQAKQFGHPLPIELKVLLLHGLLHLAGFDHETDDGEMAAREEQLRRRFRLPCTLIARSFQRNSASSRRKMR